MKKLGLALTEKLSICRQFHGRPGIFRISGASGGHVRSINLGSMDGMAKAKGAGWTRLYWLVASFALHRAQSAELVVNMISGKSHPNRGEKKA